MKVIVSQEIEHICPEFIGACVEADIVNTPYSEALWQEIETLCGKLRQTLTTESLKEITSIAAMNSGHICSISCDTITFIKVTS